MTLRAIADCPACKGAGWLVQSKDSVDSVVQCPKCRSDVRVRRLLEKAEIPPRYLDRGFEVYSTHHPKQKTAKNRCQDFVRNYPSVSRGLLFTGPCGVGKTHLSVAILKALIEKKQAVSRFADETELLRRLHYSYDRESNETERQVLRPLMEADLLVWDDLGTGRATDWAQETMRTVLNYRYTYNKTTIFTTNLPLEAQTLSTRLGPSGERGHRRPNLEETIGRRLFSRIMEMCEIVEIEGPDARTEIYKAGHDFQSRGRSVRSVAELVIPTGMIRCPACNSPKIDQQDLSSEKLSPGGPYMEVSCLCEKCNEQFAARFYPRQGKIEYPG